MGEHPLKQHAYTHKRGGSDPISGIGATIHSELGGLDLDDHPSICQRPVE